MLRDRNLRNWKTKAGKIQKEFEVVKEIGAGDAFFPLQRRVLLKACLWI